jgi:hypothetical protein
MDDNEIRLPRADENGINRMDYVSLGRTGLLVSRLLLWDAMPRWMTGAARSSRRDRVSPDAGVASQHPGGGRVGPLAASGRAAHLTPIALSRPTTTTVSQHEGHATALLGSLQYLLDDTCSNRRVLQERGELAHLCGAQVLPLHPPSISPPAVQAEPRTRLGMEPSR